MPENEAQKRKSCAWKADELITVGMRVYSVVAMVVSVGAGMEVMVEKHAGQCQER